MDVSFGSPRPQKVPEIQTAKEGRLIQTPSFKLYSSFPKGTLSCRWVISNAQAVLQGRKLESPQSQLTQGQSLGNLKFVTVGVHQLGSSHASARSVPQSQVTQGLSLKSPSVMVPLWMRDNKSIDTYWHLQIKDGNNVFLCQCSAPVTTTSMKRTRVLVSDCTFSILNPSTEQVIHSATAPERECEVDTVNQDYGVTSFIKKDGIFDDTVTIQVDATLLCFSNPIEVKNEAITTPTDYICKQMKALLNDKSFADVTIKCGDKEFKVHKAILASQSPVFKTMFQTDMREKSSNVLEISDMEPAVVSDLLEFMYTGKATNIKKLAKDLLYAANKYELPLLLKICENELMMTLTADNVAERILLADRHQATNLKTSCLKIIKSCSAEVYKTKGWKEFLASQSCNDLLCEIFN